MLSCTGWWRPTRAVPGPGGLCFTHVMPLVINMDSGLLRILHRCLEIRCLKTASMSSLPRYASIQIMVSHSERYIWGCHLCLLLR
jgi:hypothetical protein